MVRSNGTSAVAAWDGATTVAVDMTLLTDPTSSPGTTRGAGRPSGSHGAVEGIRSQEIVLTPLDLLTMWTPRPGHAARSARASATHRSPLPVRGGGGTGSESGRIGFAVPDAS